MKVLNGLIGVLLMNLTGMPLVYEELDSNVSKADPALLSGYLQALDLFGKENISGNEINSQHETVIEKTSIDYGKRKILFIKIKTIKTAVIYDDKLTNTEVLSSKIMRIGEQFLHTFNFDFSDIVIRQETFEPFKETIIRELISQDMSPWWIPKKIKVPDQIDKQLENDELFNKINGKLTISELQTDLLLSYEKICEKLYVWNNNKLIEFSNILGEDDILKIHKKGREFLSVGNPQNICITFQAKRCPFVLDNSLKSDEHNCNSLLKIIDGTKSISEIRSEYKPKTDIDSGTILQCFVDNNLVEPLNDEEMSILFDIKILQKLILVLQTNLKKSEITILLKNVLDGIHSFEISSDIKIQGNEIIADYNYA